MINVSNLSVIARNSAILYKKTAKSIQQIGEELGVDYVLSGTIRWQKFEQGQDRVRITPTLINVSDSTQVWANVYDKSFNEVFQVQLTHGGLFTIQQVIGNGSVGVFCSTFTSATITVISDEDSAFVIGDSDTGKVAVYKAGTSGTVFIKNYTNGTISLAVNVLGAVPAATSPI